MPCGLKCPLKRRVTLTNKVAHPRFLWWLREVNWVNLLNVDSLGLNNNQTVIEAMSREQTGGTMWLKEMRQSMVERWKRKGLASVTWNMELDGEMGHTNWQRGRKEHFCVKKKKLLRVHFPPFMFGPWGGNTFQYFIMVCPMPSQKWNTRQN